jgi:hypothetical protein
VSNRPATATDNNEYTGQYCNLREGSYAGGREAVFFFRPTLIYREGEGYGSRPTFTPAVVLFVTLPETETNTDPG